MRPTRSRLRLHQRIVHRAVALALLPAALGIFANSSIAEGNRSPAREIPPSRASAAVPSAVDLVGVTRKAATTPTYDTSASASTVLAPARTAEARQVEDLRSASKGAGAATRVGFTRILERPLEVLVDKETLGPRLDASGAGRLDVAGEDVVWSVRLTVEDAYRIRVNLAGVALPESAEIWVFGGDKQAIGPVGQPDVAPDGTLLCPSVFGEDVWIEAHLRRRDLEHGAPLKFAIDAVVELFDVAVATPAAARDEAGGAGCLVPLACAGNVPSAIHRAKRGVGLIEYRSGPYSYSCTGALMNDRRPEDFRPYFLTANHCIATQFEASTAEVFWDYLAPACGQAPPPLSSVPRSVGAQLLNTGASSDFTLLLLGDAPTGADGRWYFGWQISDPEPSALRYRLHHPDGLQMHYSVLDVSCVQPFCGAAAPPNFLYHDTRVGGSVGGSSGSPLFFIAGEEFYVIGQNTGSCDPTSSDVCGRRRVDGSFKVTFPYIRQLLDPFGEICRSDDTIILPGQTLDGYLAGVECPSYARPTFNDWFRFTASAGSQYEIVMTSSEFDTYLTLLNPCGLVAAEDDDGDEGTNSRLVFTASISGTHTIEATGYTSQSLGAYEVRLVRLNSAIPAAPVGLYAAGAKKKKVTLRWTDNSENESEFVVAVWDGSAWIDFLAVAANTTTANVKNLRRRTTYYFTVRARNASGASDYAPYIDVTTR